MVTQRSAKPRTPVQFRPRPPLMSEQLNNSFAFLFPGQGSQSVGMGQELVKNSPTAYQTFEEAEDILGFSISKLCFEDPKGELSGENPDTSKIQPALLTVSVATARFLHEQGVALENYTLGHSAGKYAALVENGALEFGDALRFIKERGEMMKESKKRLDSVVGMVIGLDKETIQNKLTEIGDKVASFKVTVENGSKLVMIGGLRDQWEETCKALKDAHARMVKMYNGTPLSHHPLLLEAQQRLNQLYLKLQSPNISIIDDISGQVTVSEKSIEQSIKTHLISPISWRLAVETLNSLGVRAAVETGPGEVLKNMMSREWPEIKVFTTSKWGDIKEVCRVFNLKALAGTSM